MAFNILPPVHFLNGVSMGASITSSALAIAFQDNVGIQLDWTGTPTGTFTVQISSNHYEVNGAVKTEGNWITLTLNPTITASGSGDDAYIDLNQMSAQYLRLVYTRSSGTGTLNAYLVAKGV